MSEHVLLVCSSFGATTPELVSALAAECDYVIAVDGGADMCRAAGVLPQAWCGDADSAAEETMAWIRERVKIVEELPVEKDETDLSYALGMAARLMEGMDWELVVTCASGGRPDHALGVLGLLRREAARMPIMVEQGFQCMILAPEGRASWRMGEEARGKTFSAIPLVDSRLSIENMYWELERESLGALSERGLSNWVTTSFARVECHEGCLAAFLFW